MKILAIVVMFCVFYFGTGCGVSNYDNDIAAYKLYEYDLPSTWHSLSIEPLDKQFGAMARQLIPKYLASESKGGRVILPSTDKIIMEDFQEYLYDELPEKWRITLSSSDADAIITGVLFNIAVIFEDIDNGFRVPVEPSPTIFLFWTVETDLKAKRVLSATDNYENPEIITAIEDLAKDLRDKGRLETKKDWKIALFNKSAYSMQALEALFDQSENFTFSGLVTAAVLSELVTTTAFEKAVSDRTNLVFLDKDDTSKHDSKLRQVLSSDKAQKASDQTNLAKAFCKSTGANAVLTIEQISEGGFDLKLIELPSLDIVGQGKSKRSRE